jgi:hypothetical protein
MLCQYLRVAEIPSMGGMDASKMTGKVRGQTRPSGFWAAALQECTLPGCWFCSGCIVKKCRILHNTPEAVSYTVSCSPLALALHSRTCSLRYASASMCQY